MNRNRHNDHLGGSLPLSSMLPPASAPIRPPQSVATHPKTDVAATYLSRPWRRAWRETYADAFARRGWQMYESGGRTLGTAWSAVVAGKD